MYVKEKHMKISTPILAWSAKKNVLMANDSCDYKYFSFHYALPVEHSICFID